MKRLPSSLSTEAIQAVWQESRDSNNKQAGAPGVDGITAAAFRARLIDNITRIRQDIGAGTYQFSKLRTAPVKKSSGGFRIIAVPTVRDRLLQRALLEHLEADPKFDASSPVSFGFTKGKTLSHAQRRAADLRCKHPWVLKADIIKFFDRIQRQNVKDLIRAHVRRKIIADLLCASVDCELDHEESAIAKANGIQKGVGLRQGMPVSPLLSNLLLKRFDLALSQQGLPAVRYADDLAVFGNNRTECLDALKYIRESLSKLQLDIPELKEDGKTTLAEPSDSLEFLGVEIKRFENIYKLRMPMKKLPDIEQKMNEIASVKRCLKEKNDIGYVVRRLNSLTIGYAAYMAALDNRDDFFNRLESAKRKSLNRMLVDLIGAEAVANLSDDGLAILGIGSFNKTGA